MAWLETPANKSLLSAYITTKKAAALAAQLGEKLGELSAIQGEGGVKAAVAGMSAGDRARLLKALQEC